MRPELETYYLIDRYLQGELNSEELAAFEKRMHEEASFEAEVEHQKMVNLVITGAEFQNLRETMTKDIARFDSGKSPSAKWWITGGIALLTIAGAGLVKLSEKKSPQAETRTVKTTSPVAALETPATQKEEAKETIQEHSLSRHEDNKTKSSRFSASGTDSLPPSTSPVEVAENTIKDTSDKTPAARETIKTPETKHAPMASQDPCKGTEISFGLSSTPTCSGEMKGSILVNTPKGGKGPYTYSVSPQSAASSNGHFENLPSGMYQVRVADAHGCFTEKGVAVTEKECPKPNKFVFSPDLGETWTIPGADNASGTLNIYNRGGILIFKETFGPSGVKEWNGTSLSGSPAEAGLYVYIIEFTNGKKEHGQVTVSR